MRLRTRGRLTHALWLLRATFDPDGEFVPDFRRWEEPFDDLRRRGVPGFYYGSPITRVPLGARRIFEGQARFNQLQYLHSGMAGTLTWDDFQAMGMMGELYVSAFELFLHWAELPWPGSPVDPTVALFLLVCDLAINPSDGYPFDLLDFESFIMSVDPSFRFAFFARQIAKTPSLNAAVSRCNRDAFIEVSSALCRSLVCRQPVEISEELLRWCGKSQRLEELLCEDESFGFKNDNLPIRVCFAKHIRFAQDRVVHPEFFLLAGDAFCGKPFRRGQSRRIRRTLESARTVVCRGFGWGGCSRYS